MPEAFCKQKCFIIKFIHFIYVSTYTYVDLVSQIIKIMLKLNHYIKVIKYAKKNGLCDIQIRREQVPSGFFGFWQKTDGLFVSKQECLPSGQLAVEFIFT